ncbi:MAG TPA: DUF1015 domain-containing protein [Sedimentisphaerales bacterium]|nr:DUF1015 domain-containing protein [Sedimentisphaerales bacterium]
MQVEPFKAFRFDAEVVGDAGGCIAPPYDVIDDAQREQLYAKSEHNLVRITKGKTTPSDSERNNPYTRAADFLSRWIKEGALKQDEAEAIYAYVQDFEMAGTRYRRHSFIALGKLEEFGQIVKPHEQVFPKPMIDRLSLKRATCADFGLVFMLYEDKQKVADRIMVKTTQTEPLIDFVDEQQVRHRLFAITAGKDIERIAKMMSDKSCIIADGHHRYTTGLTYSKESKNPAAGYQMLAFANIHQDGLIVLATHRLVGNLENFSMSRLIAGLGERFEVTKHGFDSPRAKTGAREKMLRQMKAEHENDKNAFGIYGADGAFYCAVLNDPDAMDQLVPDKSAAWRALDVSILHKLIIEQLLGIDEQRLARGENIEYVKDTANAIDESIAQIDAGRKQAAFFLNPVKIQQLKLVTDAGERMPQKSTYFYPKVYSGLTINKL